MRRLQVAKATIFQLLLARFTVDSNYRKYYPIRGFFEEGLITGKCESIKVAFLKRMNKSLFTLGQVLKSGYFKLSHKED